MRPVIVITIMITALAAGAGARGLAWPPSRRCRPVVRVRVAPPALRTEVRMMAPSRAISGRRITVVQGGRHSWVAGHWDLPPAPSQVWVEARWVNPSGEWLFYPGYGLRGAPRHRRPRRRPMYNPPRAAYPWALHPPN